MGISFQHLRKSPICYEGELQFTDEQGAVLNGSLDNRQELLGARSAKIDSLSNPIVVEQTMLYDLSDWRTSDRNVVQDAYGDALKLIKKLKQDKAFHFPLLM